VKKSSLKLQVEKYLKQEVGIKPIHVWVNPLNKSSMRLSLLAYRSLKKLKFQQFTHKFSERITPKHMLELDRLFKYPFYISTYNSIEVFAEEDSMMLTLNNNNLDNYLRALRLSY
jgi:hypothetical protein